jgi:protein subunit release factor B
VNLNESFGVSTAKVEELKARVARLGLDLSLVEESFVRGGGKGGQKVNTTSNCVVLRYPPLELMVRCHRERARTVNRFLALRELVDRVEERLSPGTSRRAAEIERIRRRKSRRRARSRLRPLPEPPAGPAAASGTPEP